MITDPNGLVVINPGEGEKTDLGGLGVDFKIWGDATRGVVLVLPRAAVQHGRAPAAVQVVERGGEVEDVDAVVPGVEHRQQPAVLAAGLGHPAQAELAERPRQGDGRRAAGGGRRRGVAHSGADTGP